MWLEDTSLFAVGSEVWRELRDVDEFHRYILSNALFGNRVWRRTINDLAQNFGAKIKLDMVYRKYAHAKTMPPLNIIQRIRSLQIQNFRSTLSDDAIGSVSTIDVLHGDESFMMFLLCRNGKGEQRQD